jgi:hypothetical protein
LALCLLHILYDNHEMLASEVTTSHAQAVEKPCADIAGALKDEVWRRDGDLYIFQIATDLGWIPKVSLPALACNVARLSTTDVPS